MYDALGFEAIKMGDIEQLEKEWLNKKVELVTKLEQFKQEKEDWLKMKQSYFEEIHLLEDQLQKIQNCEILTDELDLTIPETKTKFETIVMNSTESPENQEIPSSSEEATSPQPSEPVHEEKETPNSGESEEDIEETAVKKVGTKKKGSKKGTKKATKKKVESSDPFAPTPFRYSLKGSIVHHLDSVRAIVFHPTQPLLASAGDDGFIRVLDFEHKRPIGKKIVKTVQTYASLRGHESSVLSLASHGDRLYSGDINGKLCIWEFPQPQPGAVVDVYGRVDHNCIFSDIIHKDAIWSIAVSPDVIISASADGTISLHKNSDECTLIESIEIPEKPITLSFLYGSTSKFVIGCMDGTVHLYEIGETINKLSTITLNSRITCVSPNVQEILFGTVSAKVFRVIYDDNETQLSIKEEHELHSKSITGLAVLPGAQYFTTTSQDKEIRSWKLEGMELKMSERTLREKYGDAGLGVAAPPVNSMLHAFAVAGADGTIKLYTS